MWPWTDWKLRRALRRYRRERDLEAVLQMDWHRDLDLSAFFTDVEERLHGEEITRLRQKQAEYLALQNQINPHFLYNTLDSVVWMTENGRTDEAILMVTSLARFFRISLSRGSNIIPIADELEHELDHFRLQPLPAIIPIPGVTGNTGMGIKMVKKSVEQAVGSDIIFNDND